MAFTRASAAAAALKLFRSRNNGKTPERAAPEIANKAEKLAPIPSPGRPKRSNSAGVHYSDNRKICHQCRQKTLSSAVSCKNRNRGKQCSFCYCHICLLNRYEEKAEEVAALGSKWKCPRCRGVCNCCKCMEKRDCAKVQGCSSVSGVLKSEEVEKPKRNGSVAGKKRKASTGVSATSSKRIRCQSGLDEKEKSGASKKGGASSQTPKTEAAGGKGNVAKGKEKSGAIATRSKVPVKQEAANRRLKGVKKDLKSSEGTKKSNNGSAAGKKRKATTEDPATSSKRGRYKSGLDEIKKAVVGEKGDASSRMPKTKATGGKGVVKEKEKKGAIATCRKVPANKEAANRRVKGVKSDQKPCGRARKPTNAKCSTAIKKTKGKSHISYLISQATRMTKVANLDLPAEDIGPALQLLEFCEAFGQVLNLKKGQAESLLQQITCGQDTSRCDFSLERIHIKLLSMVGEDSDNGYSCMKTRGRNSWLIALDKYISGCSNASESLVLACSRLSREGYSKLDGSQKLRILTFLCDEALCTTELRMWIDKKNLEFVQERKKVKKMLIDEKKNNRVKLKNEVAKAVRAPLSTAKHENLVVEMNKGLTHSDTDNSTVIRSSPVLLDPSGRKFWKLSGCSEGVHVLLQDVANQDKVNSEEKWFVYDLKYKADIERYISSVKGSMEASL